MARYERGKGRSGREGERERSAVREEEGGLLKFSNLFVFLSLFRNDPKTCTRGGEYHNGGLGLVRHGRSWPKNELEVAIIFKDSSFSKTN